MNKQALINALFSSLGAFVCIGFLAYLNSSIEGAIWLIPPFWRINGFSHGCL